MRFKFFPGSELGPPFLLGGIVDLDKPQHIIANVVLDEQKSVAIKPIVPLAQTQLEELMQFARGLTPSEFKRVALKDIMSYTSRRRAMC